MLVVDGAGGRRDVDDAARSQRDAYGPGVGDLSHVPPRSGLQQRHARPALPDRTAGAVGTRSGHSRQLSLGQTRCTVVVCTCVCSRDVRELGCNIPIPSHSHQFVPIPNPILIMLTI